LLKMFEFAHIGFALSIYDVIQNKRCWKIFQYKLKNV
jgi:hypothetical protein